MNEIEKTKKEIEVLTKKLALLEEIEKQPKTLFDVIRNLGYSCDCSWEIVDAIEEFEKQKEKEMIKRNLKTSVNGDVRPVDDVVEETKEESWMDKPVEELVKVLEKNPPEFLKFQLSSSLEDRIYKWWNTCFVQHPEWSMEECVEDLLDIIELFLPHSQSHEGTQRIETIIAVDTHNELLQKIKSKLRNKK